MVDLSSLPVVSELRQRLGAAIFNRVAGEQGPAQRSRFEAASAEPSWFSADRPIRRVHGDASGFTGGLRALLLQSLHPLAMAGVAGHSDYKNDPWGRLQRTGMFLAVTSFGPAVEAEAMVAKIRKIHTRVNGIAPDGRAYSASDPHLLKWVHVTEVDSFLLAYQRYGADPLDQAGRDGYVADCALVARKLGVIDPPTTEAELSTQLNSFRPELKSTPQSREATRFLLLASALPVAARPAYAIISSAAVGMLPVWARWPLRLPYLPLSEATVVRVSGRALTQTIRWATTAPAA